MQRCSRSSHKEDPSHYTVIDTKSREELKRVNATITVSQISEILRNCDDVLITVEDKIIHELKQCDQDLITQCIDEANEDDQNIAYTALVFLEHLGRDMKIYDSKKLRAFLKRSIYDDNKIAHLSSYLGNI